MTEQKPYYWDGSASISQLTFGASTCEPMVTQSNLERLQGINKLQHKALSRMLAHQRGCTDQYPDRAILTILIEMGRNYGLSGAVRRDR